MVFFKIFYLPISRVRNNIVIIYNHLNIFRENLSTSTGIYHRLYYFKKCMQNYYLSWFWKTKLYYHSLVKLIYKSIVCFLLVVPIGTLYFVHWYILLNTYILCVFFLINYNSLRFQISTNPWQESLCTPENPFWSSLVYFKNHLISFFWLEF